MQLDIIDNDKFDWQFAVMVEDGEYQVFQTELAESFAESDWEVWVQAERILNVTLDL